MKHTIDWTQRTSGQVDTTGCGPWLASNYVVLLAVLSNHLWYREIVNGEVTSDQYKDQVSEIANWIFGGVSESEMAKIIEFADQLYTVIGQSTYDEFTLKNEDSLHPKIVPKRVFRSSPLLKSLVVHIGAGKFVDATETKNKTEHRETPKQLGVTNDWTWSAFQFKGTKFTNLAKYLKTRLNFSSLELILNTGTESYCQSSATQSTALGSRSNQNLINDVVVITKKQGLNRKYVIFHGPPGTGKTREANRFVQKYLAQQISDVTENQITPENFLGKWPDEKRPEYMRQIRRFLSVAQFHPSYSYEDFIEGLRPFKGTRSEVKYEVVDGSFLSLWRKAMGKYTLISIKIDQIEGASVIFSIDPYFARLYDFIVENEIQVFFDGYETLSAVQVADGRVFEVSNAPDDLVEKLRPGKEYACRLRGASWGPEFDYFLLVDEINRGKVSKIFGELLFSMASSYSDNLPEVRTQYSKTPIVLPPNLHIIATMNTCDKSVDSLDQALKRRFEFHELMPLGQQDLEKDLDWKRLVEAIESLTKLNIAKLLDSLNQALLVSGEVEYDRQIGHSYFFKAHTLFQDHCENMNADKAEYPDLMWQALARVWTTDIFPVLQEFFLDLPDTLQTLMPQGALKEGTVILNSEFRIPIDQEGNDIISNWATVGSAFKKFLDGIKDLKLDEFSNAS